MKKAASNKNEEPSKDEFFDGHRVAKTVASKLVVAHVLSLRAGRVNLNTA